MAEKLPRTHIGPTARMWANNGYHTLEKPSDPIVGPRKFPQTGKEIKRPKDANEARDVWLNGKAERYALDAVIIERVVDRALNTRSLLEPFGLFTKLDFTPLTEFGSDYDLSRLQDDFLFTLSHAYSAELDALEERRFKKDDAPEVSVYSRAVAWANYFHKYVPSRGGFVDFTDTGKKYDGRPPGPFIDQRNGIVTGVSTMIKTLGVIPAVCERNLKPQEIDPSTFVQVAKNSYGMLASSAMKIIHEFDEAEQILTGFDSKNACFASPEELFLKLPYNPYYFELADGPQGKYMRIKPDSGISQAVNTKLENMNPAYTETVGCPAAIPIHDAPATKKLWGWMTDVYGEFVRQYWSQKFEPISAQKARHNQMVEEIRKMYPNSKIAGIDF